MGNRYTIDEYAATFATNANKRNKRSSPAALCCLFPMSSSSRVAGDDDPMDTEYG